MRFLKALQTLRPLRSIVVASALLGVGLGCEPSRTETKPPPTAGTAGLASRLSAANAIGGSTERDDALAKVSVDAAQAGEGAIVKTALQQIGSTSIRDKAAADSARRLAAAGEGADAVEIAKSIGSTSLRDETLKAIAKNE